MTPVLILLGAQLVFSSKDLIARGLVKNHNFNLQLFHRPLFYLMIVLQVVGITLQLYVLSNYNLSRAMTGFAMLSILFSAALGLLVLGEDISGTMYIALVLAFASLLVLVFAVK
jgi:drug/metabolite transporter (DMT)-like permease